jgi:phosphoheptose isomerase
MLEAARRQGNATIAMLGDDGGDVRQRDIAAHTIAVPSPHKNRVAEVQATVYHTIRHAVRWLQRE